VALPLILVMRSSLGSSDRSHCCKRVIDFLTGTEDISQQSRWDIFTLQSLHTPASHDNSLQSACQGAREPLPSRLGGVFRATVQAGFHMGLDLQTRRAYQRL
jgi:hypothetical protein